MNKKREKLNLTKKFYANFIIFLIVFNIKHYFLPIDFFYYPYGSYAFHIKFVSKQFTYKQLEKCFF